MKNLRSLNKYFIKYKYYLVFGALFIIVANMFSIFKAVLVRFAFDFIERNYAVHSRFDSLGLENITQGLFRDGILLVSLVFLFCAVARGIFMFLMRQSVIVMSRKIEYDLKNEVYTHYQSLSASFYKANNTGDLVNRISEDVTKVRMYLGPAVMYGINLFTLILMVVPFMLSTNLNLTLFALSPLPILSITIFLVSDVMNKRSEEIQRGQSSLSTFVHETFSGIRVVKAFASSGVFCSRYQDQSNLYRKSAMKLVLVNSLFIPLIVLLIGLSVILTVYSGAVGVFRGEVSVGNIAEFLIYVNMLAWPVTSLGWISSIIQSAEASQKRINEFLRSRSEIRSGPAPVKQLKGTIEFVDVGFTYPETGIQALKKINFKVEAGDSLALIGTIGSGKSTISDLICRLYDTTAGKILVDGRDIRTLPLEVLRAGIGYVPQDVFLFSDTIRENVAFGHDALTEERLRSAVSDAGLDTAKENFPDGYDTVIGERGITLSGGQKQRVSIARAISKNPRILILDDALSAVDTKTEHGIISSMKRIMRGRTTIIVSHRVSSAKLANRILVLDDGQIVEMGSHNGLIDHGGTYSRLYSEQSKVGQEGP